MLELLFYGIVRGSLIALGAIGLTLVFGILKFAHFAHGDFMTAGAYAILFLLSLIHMPLNWFGISDQSFGFVSFGWHTVIALPLAMLLVAGLAILIDFLVYKKLRKKNSNPIIFAMAALGISFIIRSLVFVFWGGDQIEFRPGVLRYALRLPFDIKIRPDQIFIILISVMLITSLHFFLKKSKTGKAMRATADNMNLARISGINTEKIIRWTWGIGSALAAAAGILYGIDVKIHPEMGWYFLLPLFAATILGTIGNMYGALISGLIIGIAQEVSTAFIHGTYRPAVSFVILILILLLKPQGIFGRREQQWKL